MHRQLEERLAAFEGTEAALVFSSGFAANLGAIGALVEAGDAVYCDRKNHASLWDGCRLSRADVRVYPHGDMPRLDRLLADSGKYRRRLIVTDGLFSMDGDLAPLAELAEVARRHATMLLVDEAHATGVFGRLGRGEAEHLGVEEQIDVRVGTLSKALGGMGGFVAGSRPLVEWLANRARPYVFSTAAPAAMAAAGLAALAIVGDEPQGRDVLLGPGPNGSAPSFNVKAGTPARRPARSSPSSWAVRSAPWPSLMPCVPAAFSSPPSALPPSPTANRCCG